MSGTLVPWDDAKVHIGSHVIHYGSAVFEGVRCYKTPKGSAVFRLDAHTERLFNSAKIYWMEPRWSPEEINSAILETIAANRLEACYIRPVLYRGAGQLGVNPLGSPVEASIMVWDWGKYLGQEALEQGVDVCVSSWTRMAPNTIPAMAKSAANYMNSQLIKVEAVKGGFAEGIALDDQGYVSEGSGENVFLVHEGQLLTPAVSSSILPGITRNSILRLAEEMGIPTRRESIPRGFLYTCDEAFFTGTAVEVTPIRSVDRIPVGEGKPGPITRRLMQEYLALTRGEVADRFGWLTPVPAAVAQVS